MMWTDGLKQEWDYSIYPGKEEVQISIKARAADDVAAAVAAVAAAAVAAAAAAASIVDHQALLASAIGKWK